MAQSLLFGLLLFFTLGAGSTPTPGVNVRVCRTHLTRLAKTGAVELSGNSKTFFEKHLLPTVGRRGLTHPFTQQGNTLEWKGYPNGKLYRLEFSKNVSEPAVEDTPLTRTLFVPEQRPFRDLTPAHIKRWLLGHPLHPFMVDSQARIEREALQEPQLLHRQVQLDASLVGRTYLERFESTQDPEYQRFLYVAPTGTGKSEIYLDLLDKRLEQAGKGPSLMIVSSERANVVRDRYAEAKELREKLRGEGRDFEIVQWGGKGEANSGVHDLEGLLERVKNSQKPVVLVTTMASLRWSLGANDRKAGAEKNLEIQRNLEMLKAPLRGIFVDEAHHLGGEIISDVVERLLDGNPQATLSGFTATPISKNRSIQKLFNDHGFWAYEDDAQSYLKDPRPLHRNVSNIAKQLRTAFQEGELVGFEAIHYLPLKEDGSEEVFIKREPENRYSGSSLNLELYPRLLAKLAPILRTGRGIVVANDINEARDLTKAINKAFKADAIRAELITSDNAPAGSQKEAGILKRFKQGKTHVLVSVMKLDEGINIHDANYYIDLNPDPPARQFLQRVGRTTRVSPGKIETQVYLMSAFTEVELRGKLDAVFGKNRSSKGQLAAKHEAIESVDIDMGRFLEEMERANVERVNFWSGQNYSLPEEQLIDFQKEVILQAGSLFPGWGKKANQYLESLAEKLPLEKQAAYLKGLQGIGVSESAFRNGRTSLGSSDSVHKALVLFAQYKGETVEGRITLEHLKKWGLTTGHRYSIDDQSLKAFQQEVLKKTPELFPGWGNRTDEYFQELAQTLPASKQEAYLKELERLQLSDKAFFRGMHYPGIADSLHQAFVLYAKHKGETVDGRINFEHLKKLGLTTGQKYSIDEGSLRKFQQEVVLPSAGLFPGRGKKAGEYFRGLAQNLPTQKQAAYLAELESLGMSEAAFNSARNHLGSADTLHSAFVLYAKYKGETIEGRISSEQLKKLGLTTGQKYSVDDSSLKAFQREVVVNSLELFPGWMKKSKDYFKQLAQTLPTKKRAAYLKELESVGVSQYAFFDGRAALKTADSLHRAFILYAKHSGYSVQGPVTIQDLKNMGLIE